MKGKVGETYNIVSRADKSYALSDDSVLTGEFLEDGEVVVNYKPIPKSLEITNDKVTLKVGETEQLIPLVLPKDAEYEPIEYVMNQEGCATISETGLITAVAEGFSTISCRTRGDDYNLYVLTSVTVTKVEED